MKRIVGRKMVDNQIGQYGDDKVNPIVIDVIPTQAPWRFGWALDTINTLKAEGSLCYNMLDVGTYNGLLPFFVSQCKVSDVTTGTISVDAIEAHKLAYDAAETMAKSLRDRGLKINIYNRTFEEYKTEKTYDIITAFEILEHMKDPFFCLEKMYDLLEIGGYLMISLPEQNGVFGLRDKNPFHYWTSTVQSVVMTMFHDDRKWRIREMGDHGGLIHVLVQKLSYMR